MIEDFLLSKGAGLNSSAIGASTGRGLSMRNSFSTGDLHSLAVSSYQNTLRENYTDAMDNAGPKGDEEKDPDLRGAIRHRSSLDRIEENEQINKDKMGAPRFQQKERVQDPVFSQKNLPSDGEDSLNTSMNSFDFSLEQMEANLVLGSNLDYFSGLRQSQASQPQAQQQQQQQQQQLQQQQRRQQQQQQQQQRQHQSLDQRIAEDLSLARQPSVNDDYMRKGTKEASTSRVPNAKIQMSFSQTLQPKADGNSGDKARSLTQDLIPTPLGKGSVVNKVGGMRRVHSAGDLSSLGAMPSVRRIGKYTVEERQERIRRFREKRQARNFKKKIKYVCRKTLADSRPRVHGRFAKHVTPSPKGQQLVENVLNDMS